ncbi:MAG: sodium pump decarboxylase gamma subunit [Clostridia bacterium]|nr:sodium pump decarboxylase gamma subunit [Clostridia bacterium]
MENLQFVPMEFVENLKYMGVGMLGVFMIVGIIIIATYIVGASGSKKDKEI